MMPNVISLDLETARTHLQNAGLVLGVVRYKEDAAYVPNTVIEQEVSPYAQVAEHAAVDVTIAKKPGTADPEDQGDNTEPTVTNLNPLPVKPRAFGAPVTPSVHDIRKPAEKSTAKKPVVKKPAPRKPATKPATKPPTQ
jgi:hypothetical protein